PGPATEKTVNAPLSVVVKCTDRRYPVITLLNWSSTRRVNGIGVPAATVAGLGHPTICRLPLSTLPNVSPVTFCPLENVGTVTIGAVVPTHPGWATSRTWNWPPSASSPTPVKVNAPVPSETTDSSTVLGSFESNSWNVHPASPCSPASCAPLPL